MRLNARGRPVSPPIPNIGIKAVAKSMGTVKRMDPPQSEIRSAVTRTTEGIEIRTVVVWKKVLTAVPIPVRYIWCAQTMKLRNPRTITA